LPRSFIWKPSLDISAPNEEAVPAKPNTADGILAPETPVTTDAKSAPKPASSAQSAFVNCPNSNAPASSVVAGIYLSL
jgi:hypothetical protein